MLAKNTQVRISINMIMTTMLTPDKKQVGHRISPCYYIPSYVNRQERVIGNSNETSININIHHRRSLAINNDHSPY